jgi:hypothetical protein
LSDLGNHPEDEVENLQDKVSIQSDQSEYETGSEWNPDFLSDNEPPQDEVHEERLIIKNPHLRIFKKIVKLGQRGDMPSKYNMVKYRFQESVPEDLKPESLKNVKILEH